MADIEYENCACGGRRPKGAGVRPECGTLPVAWAIYDQGSDELIDAILHEPENKSGIYCKPLVLKTDSFSDTPLSASGTTCPRCYGHGPESDCTLCKGTGIVSTTRERGDAE